MQAHPQSYFSSLTVSLYLVVEDGFLTTEPPGKPLSAFFKYLPFDCFSILVTVIPSMSLTA